MTTPAYPSHTVEIRTASKIPKKLVPTTGPEITIWRYQKHLGGFGSGHEDWIEIVVSGTAEISAIERKVELIQHVRKGVGKDILESFRIVSREVDDRSLSIFEFRIQTDFWIIGWRQSDPKNQFGYIDFINGPEVIRTTWADYVGITDFLNCLN